MSSLKAKKIVLIRANTLRSDTRTIKMYQTIRDVSDGYAVLWNRDSVKETAPPADRLYINVPLGSKAFYLFLPIWVVWVTWRLLWLKPDLIHGCDLEGVLPAILYRSIRRVPIVYDIHDITTGKAGFPEKSLLWKLFRSADLFAMRRADVVLVPDKERLDQLHLTAGNPANNKLIQKTVVAYNSEVIPDNKKTIRFSPGQRLRLVYVGALNRDIRGVEFLLRAVKDFPMIHFDIAGMGADLPYFTEQFSSLKADNLTFWGRIDHTKAMELNEKADAMISMLNPDFENYKYASSTKIFEAMRLHKPLIVSANTVSGRIVESVQWGEIVDYSYEGVRRVLAKMSDGTAYTLDGEKAQQYSWATMRQRVIATYEKLLNVGR